jgi:hypothetical protein
MSTSNPTVAPRYFNVAEAVSNVIDSVASTMAMFRAAFELAERAEAGQRIQFDDLKKAGMF